MALTFLFDYDDTLAWNQHDYNIAQIDFFNWLLSTLGHANTPHLSIVLKIEEDIDKAQVSIMGFGMERFPTSLVKTLEAICTPAGIVVTDAMRKEAYAIGMHAFDVERYKKNGLVSGAQETLDFLALKGCNLLLLTKGDPRVQTLKFDATNIYRWFGDSVHFYDGIISEHPVPYPGRIHVCNNKSPEIILDALSGFDLNQAYHVGNSIRSDINPAVEAKIGAIYIPCETWAYERQHNGIADPSKVITLRSIGQLKDIYSTLPQ